MHSLYSAFVIEVPSGNSTHSLFSYGQGQCVSSTNIIAKNYHTNVPRSSWNGLPMGWMMRVDRWRAGCNLRFLVDPVIEWAAEVVVRFTSAGRTMQLSPLADLLMSPRDVYAPDDNDFHSVRGARRGNLACERLSLRPSSVILRENISYEVTVEDSSEAAHRMLENYLVERAIDLKGENTIEGKQRDPKLVCWIWLEGLLLTDCSFY
jgi:hypothetical protein